VAKVESPLRYYPYRDRDTELRAIQAYISGVIHGRLTTGALGRAALLWELLRHIKDVAQGAYLFAPAGFFVKARGFPFKPFHQRFRQSERDPR